MNQIAPVAADQRYGLQTSGMAPGLALLFNDALYERCKDVARIMAGAKGFTPPHLIGNSEACFGVVQISITWKLSPQLVAACTYQTPGGKIGYEGKLVQAILENSGQLLGGVTYELIGDWTQVRGKFKIVENEKKKVPQQLWKTPEDEGGLGVIVRAQVRGEDNPRELEFLMAEAFPRNSTLWIVRPSQQIKYAAARAFANTVMPGIFMGVPFDGADDEGGMIDITPARPRREEFDRKASDAQMSPAAEAETEQQTQQPETPAEDQPAEFSHADAAELGVEARTAGRPLASIPDDLPKEFHDAYKNGWRSQDDFLAKEAKNKK